MLQTKHTRKRLNLPNGCSCSNLSIHPTNWDTSHASLDCTWYISYRFYDPMFKDDPKIKGVKQVIIKGVNHLPSIIDRRRLIKKFLDNELQLLKAG